MLCALVRSIRCFWSLLLPMRMSVNSVLLRLLRESCCGLVVLRPQCRCFRPWESVHSAEDGTASEELRVGPSGEVPGNECAARPGGSFLFVCACTIVTLIRFLCHLDVFFGIQVDMVVVVGGAPPEKQKRQTVGAWAGSLDASSEVSSSSCFRSTAPFPPCFGLQRSLHYFRLLSLHSLFPPCSSTHCDQPKKRTM